MLIRRKSRLTGVVHEMELNVTQDQLDAFNRGVLIQQAFPNLTPDEREFILSGVTKDEWDQAFPEED